MTQKRWAVFRDIFGFHTGEIGVGAALLACSLNYNRTVIIIKNYLAQNVNNVEVKKP